MSFKKKMMLLLLAFFVLAACTTTIIQAPVLLELTQPVPLKIATERGAKHLFTLVQQERGWRSEVLSTKILVLPTYQENTKKVLEPSSAIYTYLQQQVSSYKGIQLISAETQGRAQANYELHSSLLMTEDKGKEKVVLSMWMIEPQSKRKLSTVSSAIRMDNPSSQPKLSRQLEPQPWLVALEESSRLMLAAATQDRSWRKQLSATQVLLVPMFDANSKENLNLTADLQAQLQKHSGGVKIATLSQTLLPQAHYIIHSALAIDKTSEGQVYDLNVWLRDAKTGRLLAHALNKVLAQGLPYALSAESKDSPIYTEPLNPNGQGFDLRQEMQRPHYTARLQLEAILTDAAQAYANAHYAKALELYETAQTMKNGMSLRSLAGRYLALIRMNRTAEARMAFADLLKYGFKHSQQLTFKILFAVDSTQFAGGDFLSGQYQVWTEEIADYLKYQQSCLLVAGHSSHSGSEAYNLKLSTARAAVIRQAMKAKQPLAGARTRAEGKGFYENIIGTGTDDFRDAVDRRVEFRKQACL
ncbi:MAG: OmpA family protein [Thiothrix sp.]|nr:MAG: OmpA family protein [Thiothrix sp.]